MTDRDSRDSDATSEAALLDAAQGGDRQAFGELTEPIRGGLWRYLCTMVRDEAAAEDLVHEAFRRALASLDSFSRKSRFSTWVYQIGINLARNHVRDRKRHARPESESRIEAAGPRTGGSPLSSAIRHEAADRLALAVERLPDSLREAFVLHHVEGFPYGEIAEMTGVAVGTLHVRSHRARALLREELGPVVDSVWIERSLDEREAEA